MNQAQAKELGLLLRRRRNQLHLSTRQAGAKAHIHQSTVVRLEQGKIIHPGFTNLGALAEALELNPIDAFTAAGYIKPEELPTLRRYLCTKYPELPTDVVRRLESQITGALRTHDVKLHADTTDEAQAA